MCGFEAVLSYDVARWVLRKLQVRLKGRRYKVRKNNKRLWDTSMVEPHYAVIFQGGLSPKALYSMLCLSCESCAQFAA